MRQVYLDHAATTPVRPEVIEVMTQFLTTGFGNPSSPHFVGRDAKIGLEEARKQVADLIKAAREEIYFTSGGTEADNWALKGIAYASETKKHFITTEIEHFAVLHCAEALEKQGHEVTYIEVDQDGLVDPDAIRRAIRQNTALVSVMYANNEVGTIQPIAEISQVCKEHSILLHTDAVQAVGQIPVDVKELGVDMLSMSAHKIYGPKGVGALYIRKGVRIAPLLHGGGHERNRRSGTENVPGIVGFGKAAELTLRELDGRREMLTMLRDKMIARIFDRIEDVRLNGHRSQRLPNNVNVSPLYIEGESMLLNLDFMGIAASSGSACTSGSLHPSHVLMAMGMSHEEAHASLRLTLGTSTTAEDIDYVVDCLEKVVKKLRAMSPLAPAGR